MHAFGVLSDGDLAQRDGKVEDRRCAFEHQAWGAATISGPIPSPPMRKDFGGHRQWVVMPASALFAAT